MYYNQQDEYEYDEEEVYDEEVEATEESYGHSVKTKGKPKPGEFIELTELSSETN